METILLGLVFAVTGAAAFDCVRFIREAARGTSAPSYEIEGSLLTPPELSFYHTLAAVVADRGVVVIKPSLVSIFWINLKDSRLYLEQRNRLASQYVDFLLCDPANLRPRIGLMLVDRSIVPAAHQEQVAFVESVFAAARLPLVFLPAKVGYTPAEIAALFEPYLTRR